MDRVRRVIKLGGSLLKHHDLARRFVSWLDRQPTVDDNILIVGGGELVEQLRTYDEHFQLGDSLSHQMAIELMALNARVVARAIDWPLVDRWNRCSGNHLLDVTAFCEQSSLPHDWSVTSDSIAAAIAVELGCELVLLKSTNDKPLNELVDEHFDIIAPKLKSWRIDCLPSRVP